MSFHFQGRGQFDGWWARRVRCEFTRLLFFGVDSVVGGSEDGADGLNPCIGRAWDRGGLEGGGVVDIYAGIETIGNWIVIVHDVVEVVDG